MDGTPVKKFGALHRLFHYKKTNLPKSCAATTMVGLGQVVYCLHRKVAARLPAGLLEPYFYWQDLDVST
jgi:hypothetical protein